MRALVLKVKEVTPPPGAVTVNQLLDEIGPFIKKISTKPIEYRVDRIFDFRGLIVHVFGDISASDCNI